MGKKDSAVLNRRKRIAELKSQANMMAEPEESGASTIAEPEESGTSTSVPDTSRLGKCGQNKRSRRLRGEPVWESDDNFL